MNVSIAFHKFSIIEHCQLMKISMIFNIISMMKQQNFLLIIQNVLKLLIDVVFLAML